MNYMASEIVALGMALSHAMGEKDDQARTVTIEISNYYSYDFSLPVAFCNTGYTLSPPKPYLGKTEQSRCSFFNKKQYVDGVLTYFCKTLNCTLAVMFCNPYDYSDKVCFGVAVLEGAVKPNAYLYNEMHLEWPISDTFKRRNAEDGETICVMQKGMNVLATMSNNIHPLIKMEIRSPLC